jgi:hypothetical protein
LPLARQQKSFEKSNSRLNLGKVSVNFKNPGNGGLFSVFEVPQMENGRWKMETGLITLVCCPEWLVKWKEAPNGR